MKLTASKIDLARACAYPFRADVEWPEEKERSHYATLGTAFHLLAERHLSGSLATPEQTLQAVGFDEETIASAIELYDVASSHLDELPRHTRTEVKFAYDPRTGDAIELASCGPRDYAEAPAGWIAGTIDFYVADDSGVYVGDFKTGWSNYTNRVDDNGQLAWGALAVASLTGHKSARVGIWKVHTESVAKYGDTHTEQDMQWWRGMMEELLERIDGKPEPVPGPHCTKKFCPLLAQCPEAQRLIRGIVPAKRDDLETPIAEAQDAYRRYRVLKSAADDHHKQAKAICEKHGLQAPHRL